MTSQTDNGSGAALHALGTLHCQPNAPKLAPDELRATLAQLPGWTLAGEKIEKTYRFPDYDRTIAFVNAIASIAQREDHHPDLSVHYDRCAVAWSTHSAGGVTLNDCICAAKTDSSYV